MTEIKFKFWKSYHLRKFNAGYCRVLLICLLFIMNGVQASEHYQIVAHPEVNEESVSANVLRAIFIMRLRTWSNGEMIKVFVLPDDNALHRSFAKERLNIFPYQLRLAWDRLVFSGTGQAPVNVDTQAEMLARVSSTPGAIGYLKTTYIKGDIHVLQIK